MTKRQKYFLYFIIKNYIETGNPISSSFFIRVMNLKISSATARSEMNTLEKLGFLEKSYTSSGRVPTTQGYEWFVKQDSFEDEDSALNEKLKDIVAKRRLSIDLTLDEAAKAISEIAGLTLVTTNNQNDEILKSIQLTPLDNTKAIIVLVTSTGRVQSKFINLNSVVNLEDVRIAVRLFKDRLIDSALREIPKKVEALEPILSKSVKNYESIIQSFISEIFNFHNQAINKVYGGNNLVQYKDMSRKELSKLIKLMEKQSIWQSIEKNIDEDQNIKIDINPNNTSILSKKITNKSSSTEVSIIGSNRLDYNKAKQALRILESIIKGK